MNFLRKIQKLDVFYKKLIVVGIIIALGIPFGFLVGRGFQRRIKEFDKEKFLQDVNFPEIEEEMKSLPLEELEETKRNLEEQLEKLAEMAEQAATSTTSTNNQ